MPRGFAVLGPTVVCMVPDLRVCLPNLSPLPHGCKHLLVRCADDYLRSGIGSLPPVFENEPITHGRAAGYRALFGVGEQLHPVDFAMLCAALGKCDAHFPEARVHDVLAMPSAVEPSGDGVLNR